MAFLRTISLALLLLLPAAAWAGKVTLQDGRVLEGVIGKVDNVAPDPNAVKSDSGTGVERIAVVDDGLRKTLIPSLRIRQVNEAASVPLEKISIPQKVAISGLRIGGNKDKRCRDRGKRDQQAVAKHGVVLPAKSAVMTIGARRAFCKGQ